MQPNSEWLGSDSRPANSNRLADLITGLNSHGCYNQEGAISTEYTGNDRASNACNYLVKHQ